MHETVVSEVWYADWGKQDESGSKGWETLNVLHSTFLILFYSYSFTVIWRWLQAVKILHDDTFSAAFTTTVIRSSMRLATWFGFEVFRPIFDYFFPFHFSRACLLIIIVVIFSLVCTGTTERIQGSCYWYLLKCTGSMMQNISIYSSGGYLGTCGRVQQ